MLDRKLHVPTNFTCVKVINVPDEHTWICISAYSFDSRLGSVQTCAVFVEQDSHEKRTSSAHFLSYELN
ncbi:uncharacterized protein FFB20_04486 [Fusarium fujikuroi]|nr:uncharacterized protein FFB20_04486 [Fusarium fujikuroi]SCN91227.1 uncharacterized protein FFC1_06325 [Fusarium fujikuroi]SCO01935.1 uncharacterized protein FFE2_09891 [Fusarium fujikuroi]SCO37829.1 uncharacterized protein FFNC_05886 [Fusarium fujikuroi]SCV34062.1 uncharacterized protein FFFS_04174 [Fusarium fujikuroi]